MAYILAHACSRLGEETGELVDEKTIPAYNAIKVNYRKVVLDVYTKCLITGIDDKGMFAPERTLTRAEAAIVLYRLANPSKRVNTKDKQAIIEEANAPITIYEVQARYNRNAKAGDTFVKKDGTKIVLKLDQYGVLGGGQGVAPDVGLLGQINEKGCLTFTYKVVDYGVWVDGSGLQLQNQTYYVNQTTGEAIGVENLCC